MFLKSCEIANTEETKNVNRIVTLNDALLAAIVRCFFFSLCILRECIKTFGNLLKFRAKSCSIMHDGVLLVIKIDELNLKVISCSRRLSRCSTLWTTSLHPTYVFMRNESGSLQY